ncbi:MAG TPA: peptidase [Cyanobacteria bacterium UBA12227]|nr:peptidase [Cyanobacteria bacterium UBA12227]HAX90381.1 peptidase [Cyanobacteria bacterium UBA11370]
MHFGRTSVHNLRRFKRSNRKRLVWLAVGFITGLLVIFVSLGLSPLRSITASSLPTPRTHPLPASLAQWQDSTSAGDYFTEVQLTPVNYLVWYQFPVKIYVDTPTEPAESSASAQRFHNWFNTVLQTIQEWSIYLPLEVVTQSEGADIVIWRSRPPIQSSINPETRKLEVIRARTAETRYEFYLRSVANEQQVLAHKFTIQLSPDQTVDYTIATARHELGHALGIWGHSPLETDSMYFSQVQNPPKISVRDINTLKRIYEQPTRLGWPLGEVGR